MNLTKIKKKWRSGGVLGAFGAPPGPQDGANGPQDGAKLKNMGKTDFADPPPWGPSWEPKSEKNVTWIHLLMFCCVFLLRLVFSSIFSEFRVLPNLRKPCFFIVFLNVFAWSSRSLINPINW